MLATYCGRVEMVKLLIDAGADMNRHMLHKGHSALSLIVSSHEHQSALADFIINEHCQKIEIFTHLLKKKTKILNFLLQTPLKNDTLKIINYLLNPQLEKDNKELKIALYQAMSTIDKKLFKFASLEIVQTIWQASMDAIHTYIKPSKHTTCFKELKKIVSKRQRQYQGIFRATHISTRPKSNVLSP